MPVKLALVGGSSTGKTTLFNKLSEQYKSDKRIAFVHESARQFFNENQVDIPFDVSNQEKILDLALLNESLAAQTNPQVIITDTSALEVIFYTRVLGDEEGAQRLEKRLKNYEKTYTQFLLMNKEDVTFKNDDVRREDKKTRDTIHVMLIDFYKTNNLSYTLISGTVSQRQQQVNETLLRFLS